MLRIVSSRGQLSLGKKYAGQYFEISQLRDGSLVLRLMKVAPESEAWLHTPEMREKFKRAKEWVARHPAAETDLDAFLDKVKGRL